MGRFVRTAVCGAARTVVWELGLALTGQSRRPDSDFFHVMSIADSACSLITSPDCISISTLPSLS